MYDYVGERLRDYLVTKYRSAESSRDHFKKEAMADIHAGMANYLKRLGMMTLEIGHFKFAEYIHIPSVIQDSKASP